MDELSEAFADLDRVRRGEDRTDAILAHFERLDAMVGWSSERYAVQRVLLLALFGAARRDAIHRAIVDCLPRCYRSMRIRAVLLRDGDPASEAFPPNPWEIDDEEDVEDAAATVWRPLRHRVPAFVKGLVERTVGLVLLEKSDGSDIALGYLLYHELPDCQVPEPMRNGPRPPFDRRHALAWEPFGDLSMFIGAAPTFRPWPPLGIVVPPELRELYAVHAGMEDGNWSLSSPSQLGLWSGTLGHTEPQLVSTDDRRGDPVGPPAGVLRLRRRPQRHVRLLAVRR